MGWRSDRKKPDFVPKGLEDSARDFSLGYMYTTGSALKGRGVLVLRSVARCPFGDNRLPPRWGGPHFVTGTPGLKPRAESFRPFGTTLHGPGSVAEQDMAPDPWNPHAKSYVA